MKTGSRAAGATFAALTMLFLGASTPAWGQSAPGEAPTPSTPSAAPAAAGSASGGYAVRLNELERKVNELKESIFRSKARLNLLKETVLHGVIGGSRAIVLHRNEMGST